MYIIQPSLHPLPSTPSLPTTPVGRSNYFMRLTTIGQLQTDSATELYIYNIDYGDRLIFVITNAICFICVQIIIVVKCTLG